MSLKNKKETLYSSFITDTYLPRGFRAKKIKKFLKNYQGKKLLDIGCGTGSFTLEMKEFAEELYGIDISQKAIQLAKEKGIKAFQMDIDEENLPFENNFFDIIFCGEVLEHVFDSDHLLEEIYRVLKPTGVAVITTPNLASYLNRFVLLFGFQPYLTGTGFKYGTGKLLSKNPCPHLRLFTYESLKELLKLYGFNIKKSWGEGFPGLPFPLAFLDNLLSKIPSLAIQLVFLVEKK